MLWVVSAFVDWIPAKVRSARHGRLTVRSFGSKGKAVALEAARCNFQKSTRKNAGYLIYKRKSWIITVGKFVEFLLEKFNHESSTVIPNDRLFGPCHTGWQIPSACGMDQWSQISQVGFFYEPRSLFEVHDTELLATYFGQCWPGGPFQPRRNELRIGWASYHLI